MNAGSKRQRDDEPQWSNTAVALPAFLGNLDAFEKILAETIMRPWVPKHLERAMGWALYIEQVADNVGGAADAAALNNALARRAGPRGQRSAALPGGSALRVLTSCADCANARSRLLRALLHCSVICRRDHLLGWLAGEYARWAPYATSNNNSSSGSGNGGAGHGGGNDGDDATEGQLAAEEWSPSAWARAHLPKVRAAFVFECAARARQQAECALMLEMGRVVQSMRAALLAMPAAAAAPSAALPVPSPARRGRWRRQPSAAFVTYCIQPETQRARAQARLLLDDLLLQCSALPLREQQQQQEQQQEQQPEQQQERQHPLPATLQRVLDVLLCSAQRNVQCAELLGLALLHALKPIAGVTPAAEAAVDAAPAAAPAGSTANCSVATAGAEGAAPCEAEAHPQAVVVAQLRLVLLAALPGARVRELPQALVLELACCCAVLEAEIIARLAVDAVDNLSSSGAFAARELLHLLLHQAHAQSCQSR